MRLQLLPQPRELHSSGRCEVDRLEIVEIAISRRELRLDSRQPIGVGESDLEHGARRTRLQRIEPAAEHLVDEQSRCSHAPMHGIATVIDSIVPVQ